MQSDITISCIVAARHLHMFNIKEIYRRFKVTYCLHVNCMSLFLKWRLFCNCDGIIFFIGSHFILIISSEVLACLINIPL